jgi:adenosylcobinamide-GDP ribazoletransferase
LLVALSFLTVFPSTWNKSPTPREISDSRAYFPVAGLLLGLLLVGLEWGSRELFPVYLTSALLLVLLVIITRGLHLDGLMDICDGLFGGYTPERRLEIMKDTHVGAFAVAGAASILLLKYAALLSLLGLKEPGKASVLLLFPMLSRWAMVIVVGAFPYARSQGLGSPFHQGSARLATAVAGAVAVVAAVLLGGTGGAAMLVGVSLLAWLLGRGMAGMLGGGLTGDTYGAVNEIAEAAALIAAVALAPYGLIEPLPKLLG